MFDRSLSSVVTLATALMLASGAFAFDDAMYPNLKGQWIGNRMPSCRGGQPSFDPTSCWGTTQTAQLTPEYKAMFEANLLDQHEGGQGTNATSTCLPPGMPMVLNAHSPMEIIVLPETTYMRVDHIRDTRRRIYTDGRRWPDPIPLGFDGYSIGRWIDTNGDGRFDTLEVETRGFKGPRSYDASGLPLHRDNKSVIKERIYLDKANPNLLHNDITVVDNGLTRPWSVEKTYRRNREPHPIWIEYICAEGQQLVKIGDDSYMLSGDGYLMPIRKGQKPPDLRYFEQAKK
jgi:hypothetical protein